VARVGIDATSVSAAGKGNSRSQRRAVESLAALGLPHELVAFVRDPAGVAVLEPAGVRVLPVRYRAALEWEQVVLPRLVRTERLDAVLTTTERLPLRAHGRYVVWLFELPRHRIEQNVRHGASAYQRAADLATRLLWRPGLRRASVIACGSQATADELRTALPETAPRIRVVHPGVDREFSPGPGRPGRYVLHVASADPRDNTETALAAFAAAGVPGVRLVVAGDLGRRRTAVEREAARLGIGEAVELTGRVSDEELLALYRGAAAYLDPTLFEGFGYQVLEAMACGTPVIASSTTSIPEVVGDAGLLRDPRSPDGFAEALRALLRDESRARDLRERGLARAALFTWERTARGLADALEVALRA
jgi:glycosyltransferase involved in cell wall biosynthesis